VKLLFYSHYFAPSIGELRLSSSPSPGVSLRCALRTEFRNSRSLSSLRRLRKTLMIGRFHFVFSVSHPLPGYSGLSAPATSFTSPVQHYFRFCSVCWRASTLLSSIMVFKRSALLDSCLLNRIAYHVLDISWPVATSSACAAGLPTIGWPLGNFGYRPLFDDSFAYALLQTSYQRNGSAG
jgi:hypothetical protein